MDYFLAGHTDFLESPLVAWQPHSDDFFTSHRLFYGLNKLRIMFL